MAIIQKQLTCQSIHWYSNILNSAFLVSKKVALVPNNFRNLEIQLILTNIAKLENEQSLHIRSSLRITDINPTNTIAIQSVSSRWKFDH